MRCSICRGGTSFEMTTGRTTGSAAWAQQPHVTQIGGQSPSSRPGCSEPVQGSPTTDLETPEALKVSNATMSASKNRRTQGF